MLRGLFRQYELVFVVADERDVVRLRTNFRGEHVHVYRLDVPPADARGLLLRYLQEVNQLRERPQWYSAPMDNCTTAIQRLAGSGERRSWWSWKLFLNGYLDERAKAANDDPRFSILIREGLPRVSLERGSAEVTR